MINDIFGRVETRRVLEQPAQSSKYHGEKTIRTNPSTDLEIGETTQKRTQTDHSSFDVDAPGLVEVTNERHENPCRPPVHSLHRRRD